MTRIVDPGVVRVKVSVADAAGMEMPNQRSHPACNVQGLGAGQVKVGWHHVAGARLEVGRPTESAVAGGNEREHQRLGSLGVADHAALERHQVLVLSREQACAYLVFRPAVGGDRALKDLHRDLRPGVPPRGARDDARRAGAQHLVQLERVPRDGLRGDVGPRAEGVARPREPRKPGQREQGARELLERVGRDADQLERRGVAYRAWQGAQSITRQRELLQARAMTE